MGHLAIDIETTGLNWLKAGIIGIGAYSKDNRHISFNKGLDINPYDYECIYHNGSYDIKIARKAGIELPYNHDTLLMASLLQYIDNSKQYFKYHDESEAKIKESLKLDVLAMKELNLRKSWKIDWKKDKPNYDQIKEHCLMDCRATYHLFEIYKEKLITNNLWNYYNKLIMPFQRLLVEIETTGIRLDMPKLLAMKIEYEELLKDWDIKFYNNNKEILDIVIKHLKQDKIAKVKPGKKKETYENRVRKIKSEEMIFNVRSHVHMNKLLTLKDIELKDKEGNRTTASKLLWKYEKDPLIGQIIKYKKDNKIYRDFLCKWEEMQINDILYPNFRMWATRTGRLSSAEPNLQQVPKDGDIRELFIPREGKVFTVVDAKQLETRLAAYFSKEQNLIQAFKDNIDVYGQIAVDLMGLECSANDVKERFPEKRQIGKQLFLATIYGQGSNSLHYLLNNEYKVPISIGECRSYKRTFNKLYPKLNKFAEELKEEILSKGYITNWFGRKVFIPRDKAYKAINYYIQGSGSELISFIQLNIVPKLPEGAKLLLLVHDEAIYEHNPKDTEIIHELIKEYMVQYINKKYNMIMDVEIKTGLNWSVK